MKKKNIKRFTSLFLIVVLCFSTVYTCYASSTYDKHLKTLKQSLGVCAVNKTLSSKTVSNGYWGSWCKTKGILSTYEADFNGDKKKELLVIYIKSSKTAYTNFPVKELRMALYAKSGTKIKKYHDIALNSKIDYGMACFSNVFTYKTGGNTNIVFQENQSAQGHAAKWWVLAVNKKNKIIVKTAVMDPGYTSGVGLYRYSTKLSADKLDGDISYYKTGKKLYSSETGVQNNSSYKRALKNELKKYGLTISTKAVGGINGYKVNFSQTSAANGKILCKIAASCKSKFSISGSSYSYTYRLTDYTKTMSKLK